MTKQEEILELQQKLDRALDEFNLGYAWRLLKRIEQLQLEQSEEVGDEA